MLAKLPLKIKLQNYVRFLCYLLEATARCIACFLLAKVEALKQTSGLCCYILNRKFRLLCSNASVFDSGSYTFYMMLTKILQSSRSNITAVLRYNKCFCF